MGILYREFKVTFSDKSLSVPFPAQTCFLFIECTFHLRQQQIVCIGSLAKVEMLKVLSHRQQNCILTVVRTLDDQESRFFIMSTHGVLFFFLFFFL